MNESLDQYARIAGTIAEIIGNAMKARAAAREMALAGGATREQIDATDAKFDHTYFAPLPPPPPPSGTYGSGSFNYGAHLTSQPDYNLIGPKEQVWYHPNFAGEGPRWYVDLIETMIGNPPLGSGWLVVWPEQE